LFYVASTFIVFEYMPITKPQIELSRVAKGILYCLTIFLLVVNISSGAKIYYLAAEDNLISSSLNPKYVSLIKHEKPKRLFSEYNYSDILIYNEIPTFIDARADIFSNVNLQDAYYLMYLKPLSTSSFKPNQEVLRNSILDIEAIIEKYQFDAFIIESDRSLAAFLLSHPDKYELLLSDDETAYFKVISE